MEQYTLIGRHYGTEPTTWVFAIVCGLISLVSRNPSLRALVLGIGSGMALSAILNLPSPFSMSLSLPGLLIGCAIGTWYQKPLSIVVKLVATVGLAALLIYYAASELSKIGERGSITLNRDALISTIRGSSAAISKARPLLIRGDRSGRWRRYGWRVQYLEGESKERAAWSGKDVFHDSQWRIYNGDDVALRVAEWANAKVEVRTHRSTGSRNRVESFPVSL